MRAVLVFMLSLLVVMSASAGKLYRWVDDDGKVHYSDKIPPSQAKHERKALSKEGVVIEKVGAAKTKEEIAREEELAKRRAEQKRLAEEQKKADQVLLRTFRSEDDIIMARNGKLSSIDAKISIIRGNIRRQKYRLAEMQSNAADMERSGRKVSKNLLKQIDTARQQIRGDYQGIINQEQQKQQIREKYAADLARFRELKNLRGDAQVDEEQQASHHSLLDTLVVCQRDCDALWQKAEQYVRDHATTSMQLLGSQIIMTRSPTKDTDVSFTVSRIKKKDGVEELFLDVQCKDTTKGDAYCGTPEVQRVRKGFRGLQAK